jgi:PDZ domain-containing protein
MVKVAGRTATQDGDLYLTTVSLQNPITPAFWIYAQFNHFATIYSAKDLTGGLNSSQYNLVNQFYMQTAQNTAVYQAFKLANKPYKLVYDGVYVLQIDQNSTFNGKLQIADTVTGVDGKTFESSAALMRYVQSQKIGSPVTIAVTRMDGSKHNFSGKIIKLSNGKPGIGIGLVDHTGVTTTPKVTIDAGAIGGPSAGMMFTLEIYSQLTGKDLTQGKRIAGTGTINEDGTIGQIGGEDKKVATASKEGAVVFLVPDSGGKTADDNNYIGAKEAAKKLGTKMKIVPVKTLKDALTYLETGKVVD